MTKTEGSIVTSAVVAAFFYFVYRVAIKGRPLSLQAAIPTPVPGVDRVVAVPVTRNPVP